MKILREGKQRAWAKRFICGGVGGHSNGCGAFLLVDEDDLYLPDQDCGEEPLTPAFACPCCGQEIPVQGAPKRTYPSRRRKPFLKCGRAHS